VHQDQNHHRWNMVLAKPRDLRCVGEVHKNSARRAPTHISDDFDREREITCPTFPKRRLSLKSIYRLVLKRTFHLEVDQTRSQIRPENSHSSHDEN